MSMRDQIRAAASAGDRPALAALLDTAAGAAFTAAWALDAAAAAGHVPLLEWLMDERGVAPQEDALVAAARGGHAGALRTLLDRAAAQPGGMPQAWPQTALCCAARSCGLDCMRVCLQAGAQPGGEALAASFASGHQAPLVLLLETGASLERDGGAALVSLAGEGDEDDRFNPAAEERAAAGIQFLLSRGVPVSAVDADGLTALHAAVGAGRLEVARLLLAEGADPNAADAWGGRPLHMFSTLGDRAREEDGHDNNMCEGAEALLAALLDAGADVNAPTNSGWRLAHALAEFGAFNLLRFAVDRGADLEAQDAQGRSSWCHLLQWRADLGWDVRDEYFVDFEALHQSVHARARAAHDALAAELRREREALPQGLRSLVVGAAAEVRRLDAARGAGEAAAKAAEARAQAAAEAAEARAEAAEARRAAAEAAAREAEAQLARLRVRLRALTADGEAAAAAMGDA
jgi:ankyrin repeat protein